jgi:hypothetical protein
MILELTNAEIDSALKAYIKRNILPKEYHDSIECERVILFKTRPSFDVTFWEHSSIFLKVLANRYDPLLGPQLFCCASDEITEIEITNHTGDTFQKSDVVEVDANALVAIRNCGFDHPVSPKELLP